LKVKEEENIIDAIIAKYRELNITAYEVAQYTPLTEAGVIKIFKGDSKKPRQTTIDVLIKFLEDKYNVARSQFYSIESNSNILYKEMYKDSSLINNKFENITLDDIALYCIVHDKELMENEVFKTYINNKQSKALKEYAENLLREKGIL